MKQRDRAVLKKSNSTVKLEDRQKWLNKCDMPLKNKYLWIVKYYNNKKQTPTWIFKYLIAYRNT